VAKATSRARYGQALESLLREGESKSIKRKTPPPNRAMVYLDRSPNPAQIPTPHQAERFSPRRARSKKYSVPAQKAISGASGVMIIPVPKKNGIVERSKRDLKATDLSKQFLVKPYMKEAATTHERKAPILTKNSVWPKTAVKSAMSQATIGGDLNSRYPNAERSSNNRLPGV